MKINKSIIDQIVKEEVQKFLVENEIYEYFVAQGLREAWAKNATRQVVELVDQGMDKNAAIEEIYGKL